MSLLGRREQFLTELSAGETWENRHSWMTEKGHGVSSECLAAGGLYLQSSQPWVLKWQGTMADHPAVPTVDWPHCNALCGHPGLGLPPGPRALALTLTWVCTCVQAQGLGMTARALYLDTNPLGTLPLQAALGAGRRVFSAVHPRSHHQATALRRPAWQPASLIPLDSAGTPGALLSSWRSHWHSRQPETHEGDLWAGWHYPRASHYVTRRGDSGCGFAVPDSFP